MLTNYISREYITQVKVLVGETLEEPPAHFSKLETDVNATTSGPPVHLAFRQHDDLEYPRPIQYIRLFSDLALATSQGYEIISTNLKIGNGPKCPPTYIGYKRVKAFALQQWSGSAIEAIRWRSGEEEEEEDSEWIRIPQNLNQHLLHQGAQVLFLEYRVRALGSFVCSNAQPKSQKTTQQLSNKFKFAHAQWTHATQLIRKDWNAKFASEMPSLVEILERNARHVLRYENSQLQQLARDKIPLRRLNERALRSSQSSSLPLAESLLRELMQWFKTEFFTWMNAPKCQKCQTPTTRAVMGRGLEQRPTAEEVAGEASRIELYQCTTCQCITRFPRYNHPAKLLETRTGRCGEWANCFTLCCRAMGYSARYVYDVTDHVWTEVYSEHARGWIHCDSCENQMNQPLSYESGWGKKLSYIFAFSKDEVVDVMRYVVNPCGHNHDFVAIQVFIFIHL